LFWSASGLSGCLSAHLVPRVVGWLNFERSVNQLSEQVLHVLQVRQLLQQLLLRHVPTSPVEAQVKVGFGGRLDNSFPLLVCEWTAPRGKAGKGRGRSQKKRYSDRRKAWQVLEGGLPKAGQATGLSNFWDSLKLAWVTRLLTTDENAT